MNRPLFTLSVASLLVTALLFAVYPAHSQNSEPNVRIDENGDGRVTITFEPESNYFPTHPGMQISHDDLEPFGAEFVQSPFSQGETVTVTVQECGNQYQASSNITCYISSGDDDMHAAHIDGDRIRLNFYPPIAAINFRAASPVKTNRMSVYVALLNEDGQPDLDDRTSQSKSEKPDRAAYFQELLNSDRGRYLEENANPDNFWVSVRAGNLNAGNNRYYSAEIDFDHDNETVGGLLDTIELIRVLDDMGNVLIEPSRADISLTSILTSEATLTTHAEPITIPPDENQDTRQVVSAFPPAERVRLVVDWDSARRVNNMYSDAELGAQYTVPDPIILSIQVPLLLPLKAVESPIVVAREDFYHAVVKRDDGVLSIHGSRLASVDDTGQRENGSDAGVIIYLETETGWAASFELFAIPYLVMFDCDLSSVTCANGVQIKREIDELVTVLGSRGE